MVALIFGAPIGSEDFVEEFVTKKVSEWKKELQKLAKVASTQPHTTFQAFTHGYVHNFTYLLNSYALPPSLT